MVWPSPRMDGVEDSELGLQHDPRRIFDNFPRRIEHGLFERCISEQDTFEFDFFDISEPVTSDIPELDILEPDLFGILGRDIYFSRLNTYISKRDIFFAGLHDPNNYPYLKSPECLILKKRANLEKMESANLLRLLQKVSTACRCEGGDITGSTSASTGFDQRRPYSSKIPHNHAELHYEKALETQRKPLFFGGSRSQKGIWLSLLEEEDANIDWTSETLEDLTDHVLTDHPAFDVNTFWRDNTFGPGDLAWYEGRRRQKSLMLANRGPGAKGMSSVSTNPFLPIELPLLKFQRIRDVATEPDQRLSTLSHITPDNSSHTQGSLFTDNDLCSNPAPNTATLLHDFVPPYGSDDRPHHDKLCHSYTSALSPYTRHYHTSRLYATKRCTRQLLPTLALLSLTTPPLVLAQGTARDVIQHATAGVSFAASAALPPLRSFDDLAPAYWIALYSVWGAAFLTAFTLALQRRVLSGMVIFVGIDLLGSLGQNVSTQLDAVAVWGPLALTISLYLISGLCELMSLNRAVRLMGSA